GAVHWASSPARDRRSISSPLVLTARMLHFSAGSGTLISEGRFGPAMVAQANRASRSRAVCGTANEQLEFRDLRSSTASTKVKGLNQPHRAMVVPYLRDGPAGRQFEGMFVPTPGEKQEAAMTTKIREAMTQKVRMATPDQTIREAARIMIECDAGVLPVGEDDRLIGVITDRDIATRAVAEGKSPETAVREVMSKEVLYCFEDEDVEHVAKNMSDNKVRRLPVLNRKKRLVGIVSIADL